MNPSLILRTSAPILLYMPLAVSLYVLLRGHNEPGGGFLGGLLAASGVLFYAVARGAEDAERKIRISPIALAAAGVLIAAASGLPALFAGGDAYLTHLWTTIGLGLDLPVGTTLIFDLGVYLAVIGTACTIFLALVRWQEEGEGEADAGADPSPTDNHQA